MATAIDFIEYVCEQIKNTGDVRYRKMFGEYMVYVNDKPVLLVCDNTVYVKMISELNNLMENVEQACPYPQAKPHYILDIDNIELAEQVVSILEAVTPVPEKKRRSR